MSQLKNAAIAAALSALDGNKGGSKDRPALTGVGAVAVGAALYTAGRAAFKGRRLLRERLFPNQAEADEEPDHGSSSKPGTQPSLELPQQRWPRMASNERSTHRSRRANAAEAPKPTSTR